MSVSSSESGASTTGYCKIDSFCRLKALFPDIRVDLDDTRTLPEVEKLSDDTFFRLMTKIVEFNNLMRLSMSQTNEMSTYFSIGYLMNHLSSLGNYEFIRKEVQKNSWLNQEEILQSKDAIEFVSIGDPESIISFNVVYHTTSGGSSASRIGFIYEAAYIAPGTATINSMVDNPIYHLYAQLVASLRANYEKGFKVPVYGCYGSSDDLYFVAATLSSDGNKIVITPPHQRFVLFGHDSTGDFKDCVLATHTTKTAIEHLLYFLYENRLADVDIAQYLETTEQFLEDSVAHFKKSYSLTAEARLSAAKKALIKAENEKDTYVHQAAAAEIALSKIERDRDAYAQQNAILMKEVEKLKRQANK